MLFVVKKLSQRNIILYIRGVQQATRGPQPGPASHLVWPLPTLRFFPMHEILMYLKKLNFLCGPARCLKLVIWPTDKRCCTPLLYIKTKILIGHKNLSIKKSQLSFHEPSQVNLYEIKTLFYAFSAGRFSLG